jgi:flagellar motor switch protein FliN
MQPADTPTNEQDELAASLNLTQDPDGIALGAAPQTELQGPMERVIDVPLTVTLRFGQRQLTLRELLQLNTGSLLELDQRVEEPVHLMLGDRVIARGEVVIVDGNYGMRVLEVIEHTAAKRLAALTAT